MKFERVSNESFSDEEGAKLISVLRAGYAKKSSDNLSQRIKENVAESDNVFICRNSLGVIIGGLTSKNRFDGEVTEVTEFSITHDYMGKGIGSVLFGELVEDIHKKEKIIAGVTRNVKFVKFLSRFCLNKRDISPDIHAPFMSRGSHLNEVALAIAGSNHVENKFNGTIFKTDAFQTGGVFANNGDPEIYDIRAYLEPFYYYNELVDEHYGLIVVGKVGK